MPPIRTNRNRKPPPDGFDDLEDTLLEFANKMKDGKLASGPYFQFPPPVLVFFFAYVLIPTSIALQDNVRREAQTNMEIATPLQPRMRLTKENGRTKPHGRFSKYRINVSSLPLRAVRATKANQTTLVQVQGIYTTSTTTKKRSRRIFTTGY